MCGYGQGTEYLKWELEQDGFISHYIYQEVPPKVEYSLTDLGKSFIPILKDMKSWSDTHLM